jgi:N-acetylglucosamine kinase-like BadF-type ATPase/mannose-6-phosphate isomerase class I
MKILAGIDGGGTRTRLALALSDGTMLGSAEAGCCSFVELGVPGATEAFRSLWHAAWANVGQAPRPADALFIGSGSILSEADEKTCECIAVSAGLARVGAVRARNDAWSALAGGLRGQPGILLIAGTGSACLGRNSAGQTWRAAGWGHLLHDGGSAYALGLGAMIAATRETDRRGPTTSLTPIVLRTLELRDMTEIYRRVHHDGVSRALVASLAPAVVQAATDGDAVASELLETGAAQLVEAVVTVARQLGLHAPLLALTGGLIENAPPYRRHFLNRLATALPSFALATDGLDPVWGSVLLAHEQLTGRPAPAEFLAKLKPGREKSPPVKRSSYDKFPVVPVPDAAEACVVGWNAIGERLREVIARRGTRRTVLVVECYPGVHEDEVRQELERRLQPALTVKAADAMLSPAKVDALVEPFLGGDDPVFGFLSDLTLPQFFDEERLRHGREIIRSVARGVVLVVGCGARLFHEGDLLVYADLARWEAQLRFRRNEVGNLGVENPALAASLQYKRAFFVDWRVADRWKRPLIGRWDFVLDTHQPREPKLADGEAVRRGLRHAVTRPFRVVPFFDPAPWGGQWMKKVCDLDPSAKNYGWCFDCVPEENSLWLDFGDTHLEIPSLNLVFDQPRALLGEAVFAQFGAEFPIRFDLLDTMGGGNLSFQVHPLKDYIRQHFGPAYTQDESYYLLDAGPEAAVYLGLRDDVDRTAMLRDLQAARTGGAPFPADDYANRFPAKKHDHFLIPAGTVHCSGAHSMVLEISATPYIFTFKLWDWGRLGLDGRPRPIHLEHGAANIQWDRTTDWVKRQLVNRVEPLGSGEGWREERTGLHELEFIETRRHWFTGPVIHDTRGGVNVLNLVEGDEAVMESPDGAFEPFVIHYAETVIVPAAVGRYTIRPTGASAGRELATLKAFVRT